MVATRLITRCIGKGKTIAVSIAECLDYGNNPLKTECSERGSWKKEYFEMQKEYASPCQKMAKNAVRVCELRCNQIFCHNTVPSSSEIFSGILSSEISI